MRRPEAVVLAAFVLVVVIGGANFVAVRFSNRELPPFWGAGIRFVASSLLLFVLVAALRLPLPRGRALLAAALWGILNFGVAYALAYWALLGAPAALASAIVAAAPLLTLFIAAANGLERITWRGIAGGLVVIVGVAVIFADQLSAAVSPAAFAALVALAFVIAASTVILKRLPRMHPVATNAVAMPPGAAALLLLGFLAREPAVLPTLAEVQLALVYLVLSTVALFVGFAFVVKRWTASASAYATVLFPVVTVALGAILARELVSLAFVSGAGLVMLGTYVGALAHVAPRAVSATAGD